MTERAMIFQTWASHHHIYTFHVDIGHMLQSLSLKSITERGTSTARKLIQIILDLRTGKQHKGGPKKSVKRAKGQAR